MHLLEMIPGHCAKQQRPRRTSSAVGRRLKGAAGCDAAAAAGRSGIALVGQQALVGCVEIESGAACPRMRSWSSS